MTQNRLRAWSIWLLSAFFMFYKFALEVSPSVMTTTLMSTFRMDGVELGNLAASYFYAYLLFQIPAGLLLDKFGPRKVTTAAIALCSVGSLVFAHSETLLVACIGRFIIGIGAAFAAVNCLKLIALWFPHRKFAFMAGLMMSLAMLGAVGGQAPLSALIESMGWRPAIQAIAVLGLALAIIFWLVVRDVSPVKAEKKSTAPRQLPMVKSLKTIFKNPQSWWLSIYSGFAFAPVMVFGGLWGVSFAQEAYGISKNFAAQSVSLIFIGFAIGAPTLGWFSDRIGLRKPVMFWGTLLAFVSLTLVIYVPYFTGFFLMFFLFFLGFTISSFLLCFTMIREITSTLLAATAVGFMNAFDALLGAVSDPLAGRILDLRWAGKLFEGARVYTVEAYKVAFIILPIFLVISLLVLIPIKETHCKSIAAPDTLP
jgi:MFS family permease